MQQRARDRIRGKREKRIARIAPIKINMFPYPLYPILDFIMNYIPELKFNLDYRFLAVKLKKLCHV